MNEDNVTKFQGNKDIDGPLSPRQILLDVLNGVDDMETVVVCVKYKNGGIGGAWSTSDLDCKLGLLEVTKQQVYYHSIPSEYDEE